MRRLAPPLALLLVLLPLTACGGVHGERGVPLLLAAPRDRHEEQGQHRGEPSHGRSTTTLVDFTDAMARTPGSRPSTTASTSS